MLRSDNDSGILNNSDLARGLTPCVTARPRHKPGLLVEELNMAEWNFQLLYLVAPWSWATCSTSVCQCFLNRKTGLSVPVPQGLWWGIRSANTFEVLRQCKAHGKRSMNVSYFESLRIEKIPSPLRPHPTSICKSETKFWSLHMATFRGFSCNNNVS